MCKPITVNEVAEMLVRPCLIELEAGEFDLTNHLEDIPVIDTAELIREIKKIIFSYNKRRYEQNETVNFAYLSSVNQSNDIDSAQQQRIVSICLKRINLPTRKDFQNHLQTVSRLFSNLNLSYQLCSIRNATFTSFLAFEIAGFDYIERICKSIIEAEDAPCLNGFTFCKQIKRVECYHEDKGAFVIDVCATDPVVQKAFVALQTTYEQTNKEYEAEKKKLDMKRMAQLVKSFEENAPVVLKSVGISDDEITKRLIAAQKR